MLKLCGFHISNYFNKARIAMLEKGVRFELDPTCRPSQGEDFLARTPMGKVPFLEIDGAQLCESQVICEYLEDAYPARPLYPRDALERARVRELITLMELHVELVARRLGELAELGEVGGEPASRVRSILEPHQSSTIAPFLPHMKGRHAQQRAAQRRSSEMPAAVDVTSSTS